MFGKGDSTELADRIQALLDDASVSTEEKIRTLEDARLDLLERQRATEENMEPTSAAGTGKIGEQLQQITNALTALRERTPDAS